MSALPHRIERNPSAPIALKYQIEHIAADVGRLRRRFVSNDGWSGLYIVERIAHGLETVDGILHADAAELVRVHDFTVDQALAAVDRRRATFRRLLGESQR